MTAQYLPIFRDAEVFDRFKTRMGPSLPFSDLEDWSIKRRELSEDCAPGGLQRAHFDEGLREKEVHLAEFLVYCDDNPTFRSLLEFAEKRWLEDQVR